jgi:hypothetical protein
MVFSVKESIQTLTAFGSFKVRGLKRRPIEKILDFSYRNSIEFL